jgi:HAD superfamily hydrolase (TIGR01509 family)
LLSTNDTAPEIQIRCMTVWPAPVAAVILDMDGLLLDTERVYRRAFIAAAARLGFVMPEDLYQGMVGLADNECFALIKDHFGPKLRISQYRHELADCLQQFFCTGIPLKPGALELMDDLAQRGLPRALATSTNRATAERHLRCAGLLDRFDAIVTWEDVERGKPHPDLFLKAAREIGVAPQRCVVLEDSPLGIRGAHAAGAMPVMVPDLLAATEELRSMCVAVVKDLYEARALLHTAFLYAP